MNSSSARAVSADQPVPTEFDVPPEVRNTDRVRQSLANEYPIGLRDAGVGCHVVGEIVAGRCGDIDLGS